MELPEISTEQNNIIQQLLLNNNVVVDSVAGSGKTTSNLHIAKYFNNHNILLLTYNSKLKLETRGKARKIGISNLEVHSYHSFCVKYYDNQCFTDSVIAKIIKNKNKQLEKFTFDLIVLDEAQDITSLYYELICKIYKDNENINTKICIFGDKKQSIFDFNNADQRFIEYATELFNFNSYNWAICSLSVSFRITYEMSLFINKCLLKEERIISNKIKNNKPRYIICNCFDTLRTFGEIRYYFELGYKPNEIAILAPSVKGIKNPVRLLENKIKIEMPNVMIYVSTNEDEKLDEELLEGKIIFSTFHQMKGMERKVVIIFSLDKSYFTFYKKKSNQFVCPNEIYVATTRGIEQLTLFHHYQNEYLPFIDKINIQRYCYFEDTNMNISSVIQFSANITSITDIIKFLPQNIIDECFNRLEITQNSKYVIKKINIPLKISNDNTTESVSEITGIAIPKPHALYSLRTTPCGLRDFGRQGCGLNPTTVCVNRVEPQGGAKRHAREGHIPSMFELKLKNKMSILELLADFEKKVINRSLEKKHNINNIDIQNLTSQELLYISNCWNTFKTGYIFKIYQITNYDWLSDKKLDKCINRLTELNISINSLFEYNLETENETELLNRKLIGFIDCIDKENNIVYEFKCVQKLEKEHYLQLALYMYMYELEKIKHIKRIKNHFIHMKEQIIENICINKKQLIDYKNKIYEYSVGDIIKTSHPLIPTRCFAPTERYAFLFGRQGCGFNPGMRNVG